MSEVTIFMCGPKKDHECDTDGPELIGGDDWQMELLKAKSEDKRRARWGSVSCSKCGMSAMEADLWRDTL